MTNQKTSKETMLFPAKDRISLTMDRRVIEAARKALGKRCYSCSRNNRDLSQMIEALLITKLNLNL